MLSYSFSKRMSEKQVVITKVGGESSLPPSPKNKEEGGTVRKPLKSILKVKGVADPAKPPPLKKTAKRSNRIRIPTASGTKRQRKTVRQRVSRLSDSEAEAIAQKSGLVKGKNTPPALTRKILESGITAGFVSLR